MANSRVWNIPHLAHTQEDYNQGAIAQDTDHEDQGEQDGDNVSFRASTVWHVGCLCHRQFAGIFGSQVQEGPLGGRGSQIPESLRNVVRVGQRR